MSPLGLLPHTGRRRPFWVALLGLVLLLGTMDFHPSGELHSFLEPLGSSEYSPEAAHPGQPLHLEPGAVVARPHCPVCIQRLQLGGLHLPVATRLELPAPRVLWLAAADVPSLSCTSRSSGARGPPLS
jgi:hypothetical protein